MKFDDHFPADAYLRPARPNLDVALGAHVHRILFDTENVAVGVQITLQSKGTNK